MSRQNEFETRLRFERVKRRIPQQQLADLARIRQQDLSEFERGRKIPLPEELERLAFVLQISPASILTKPVKVVLEEVVEP